LSDLGGKIDLRLMKKAESRIRAEQIFAKDEEPKILQNR